MIHRCRGKQAFLVKGFYLFTFMLGLFLVSDAHADYPQVSFASPSDGTTVNGEVNIRVNASDTDGIARVDLYIDGEKRASKSSGPFEWTWGSNENGTHQLAARAYDKRGYSRTVGVKITKDTTGSTGETSGDTTAPSVSFSSPKSGATVDGEIKIAVNAYDSGGIARVDLYINGEKRSSKTAGPFEWNWNSTDDGTYYLMVKAYDKAGNEGSSLINIKRGSTQTDSGTASGGDSTPPSVSFASPGNGSTVDGEVKIQVNASDSGGMDRVDLYINGEKKASKSSGPYEWTWGSTSEGKFDLTAKAYDRAGNGSTASTSVTRTSTSTTSPTQSSYTGGALPVFPGAEGYGTTTPAGRGGKIIKVTNLNDSGSGSLRSALEASGARIVVFEVGGVINLNSNITISSPYISVYGQSAPYPGIMLKNAGIRVFTHDVLIQHLAIRPGPQAGAYDDCITIEGGGASNFYNIVLDHLSLTWAQDEQFVIYSGAHDITLSNSILASEGMGEEHGSLIGDTAPNITVRRNLFVHNHNRNPALKGGAKAVIVNNLSYNFAGDASYLSDNYNKGPILASFVGNVFLKGPWYTSYNGGGIAVVSNVSSSSRVYQAHNYFDGSGSVYRNYASSSVTANSSPLDLSSYTIETDWSKVRSQVLANAGTRPAYRDSVDQRLVNDVNNRTASARGNYPYYSTNFRTLGLPADPHGDSDGNGYSNIEDLMYRMASEVEGR